MRELPEPWNTAAEKAGVRQTYRGIAERAGLSHVTVQRLIAQGRTTVSTVRKVADALEVEQATIYEWAGIELSEWGPWDPPASAHKMSPRTRAAVEELIRAITEGDAGWSATGSSEDDVDPGSGTDPRPDADRADLTYEGDVVIDSTSRDELARRREGSDRAADGSPDPLETSDVLPTAARQRRPGPGSSRLGRAGGDDSQDDEAGR